LEKQFAEMLVEKLKKVKGSLLKVASSSHQMEIIDKSKEDLKSKGFESTNKTA